MSEKKYIIDVNDFCEELNLQRLWCEVQEFTLLDTGINRPGLQFHGYYEYFDEKRIQVVGKVEISYLMSLPPEIRKKRIEEYFTCDFPCLIVCWNLPDADMFLEAAKKYNRILLRAGEKTSTFVYHLMDYIDLVTAPSTTMHGVLVEVHGVGVLITGASGIGKSETAIELIQRGSNLISDDMVDISCYHGRTLIGTAPEMLRYYMEVRGIGIIDVSTLYGAKSVKQAVEIDLMIKLENWNDKTPYDRLGLDEETTEILGVSIPLVTVPVSSGRNLAIIIETAAINARMKALGIRSAEIFCDSVTRNNEELYEKSLQKENKQKAPGLSQNTKVYDENLADKDETLKESTVFNDQKTEEKQ
ncbi:MAG: HPr(Ser) kinase/phosphatase [Eubacteriaceae bacterium]|jgi:HPr kinase/phosphorylase